MSTHSNTNSLDDARTDDERVYPAEDAYGPRRSTSAWKRIEPGLSGGSIEVHRACHAEAGYHHGEERPPRYRKKHSLGVTS